MRIRDRASLLRPSPAVHDTGGCWRPHVSRRTNVNAMDCKRREMFTQEPFDDSLATTNAGNSNAAARMHKPSDRCDNWFCDALLQFRERFKLFRNGVLMKVLLCQLVPIFQGRMI